MQIHSCTRGTTLQQSSIHIIIEQTSLKSMSMFERPSGSKPMSPGMVPSNFSGCGIKGIALLLAMLRELGEVCTARFMGMGVTKADALPMRAAKEAKVVFMVLFVE